MELLKESYAREVGDGLSYDFKLGCQLGSEGESWLRTISVWVGKRMCEGFHSSRHLISTSEPLNKVEKHQIRIS